MSCLPVPGVILLAAVSLSAAGPKGATSFVAADHVRKVIYHSTQTPGYTCWVGAWVMPDGSLMVTFKQATGPLKDRPRARDLLVKRASTRTSRPATSPAWTSPTSTSARPTAAPPG